MSTPLLSGSGARALLQRQRPAASGEEAGARPAVHRHASLGNMTATVLGTTLGATFAALAAETIGNVAGDSAPFDGAASSAFDAVSAAAQSVFDPLGMIRQR